MAINGSGIHDTARVLKIDKNTVILDAPKFLNRFPNLGPADHRAT